MGMDTRAKKTLAGIGEGAGGKKKRKKGSSKR